MKKFLKRLTVMLCVLSVCLVGRGVPALASYDPSNPDVDENWEKGFYGWIDDVYYEIDKARGEARAFHKTALKEVTLPSKVTKVEYAAFKSCSNLSKVTLKSTKKAPVFEKKVFGNTKSGLSFYVKNKIVAKSLKKALKGTGVKKAKIYVGKKLVYKNVQ